MPASVMDLQIADIDKRLYNLEQLITSLRGPFGNSNFPNGITVGDAGISVGGEVNLDLVSSPPTDLTLTPGSFYSDIYVDVSWVAPADGSAHMYDVEWSIKNPDNSYTLVNVARIGGNSYRIENLRPQTTYGVRVYGVNRVGLPSASIPAVGLQNVATGLDSSIPAPVSGIAVFAAPHALIVRWNDNSDPDVTFGAGSYVVEVSTNATFTAIIKTSHVSGTIATFTDLPSATTYYVRVSAIDSSGNQGPSTSAGSATTGQVGLGDMAFNSVGANQVVANSIASTHIATVGLDAGTIKFGTMDGSLANIIHLKANNIDTSSLTTQTITLAGGSLQAGSPPTTGLLINSQGIRLYSGGAQVVVLDVGGTATFSGTISGASITGTTSINIGNFSFSTSAFAIVAATSYSDTRAIKWTGGGGSTQARLWTYDAGNLGKAFNGNFHIDANEMDLSADVFRISSASGTSGYISIFPNGAGSPGNVILGSGAAGSLVSVSTGTPLLVGSTGGAVMPAFEARGYSGLFDNAWDVGIVIGGNETTVRVVGADNAYYQPIRASAFWVTSDPDEKNVLNPLAPGEGLSIVSSTSRPYRFKWKHGADVDTVRIGLSSIDMPTEVRHESKIRKMNAPRLKGPNDPAEFADKNMRDVVQVDPQVEIAILWAAMQDLISNIRDLTDRLSKVEKKAA